MWPVATILDAANRYWIGSRSEEEGLEGLEVTVPVNLPIKRILLC